MSRNYWELLNARIATGTNLCVGLDPNLERIPVSLRTECTKEGALDIFGREIIDATKGYAAAFKLNLGFFLAHGVMGLDILRGLIARIQSSSIVPVILDCKVADIGDTNVAYAHAYFDYLDADAITVHPYLGSQAMQPFLERSDKGIYVLCRTSNPGAYQFQDLKFWGPSSMIVPGMPLYRLVAETVHGYWNTRSNCGLVTGATYPTEITEIRGIVPNMPLLIPGIGKQGGDLEAAVKAAMGPDGTAPFIINVSSAICHASGGDDFAEAAAAKAKFYRDEINRFRQTKEVMP